MSRKLLLSVSVLGLTVAGLMWVAPHVADMLTRGSADTSPVPPEILLERAAKIRKCTFDELRSS